MWMYIFHFKNIDTLYKCWINSCIKKHTFPDMYVAKCMTFSFFLLYLAGRFSQGVVTLWKAISLLLLLCCLWACHAAEIVWRELCVCVCVCVCVYVCVSVCGALSSPEWAVYLSVFCREIDFASHSYHKYQNHICAAFPVAATSSFSSK